MGAPVIQLEEVTLQSKSANQHSSNYFRVGEQSKLTTAILIGIHTTFCNFIGSFSGVRLLTTHYHGSLFRDIHSAFNIFEVAPSRTPPDRDIHDSTYPIMEEEIDSQIDDEIDLQATALYAHLLPDKPGKVKPRFFVECIRRSGSIAFCKLASCEGEIEASNYRIAVAPPVGTKTTNYNRNAGKSQTNNQNLQNRAIVTEKNHVNSSLDLYHVRCFEKIADLSKPDNLRRIEPVTRFNARLRFVQEALPGQDQNFLCDGAVEVLINAWKDQRARWIHQREGQEIESIVDDDIVQHNAGSPELSASGASPGMTEQDYSLLLDPYESDGPDDIQEWNLFDTFLIAKEASLDDRRDLSRMLKKWEDYLVSVLLF